MKKRTCIGWVWLRDQQRPIVDISQVGRKSLYVVTLGNGQHKRIKKEDIIELKEEVNLCPSFSGIYPLLILQS